jgi:hypothetical protein
VLSDNRKYRKFTSKPKLEIVLASLRGDRSVAALCREHEIAHRRGGYRDPESQAFNESWFAKLKERCISRGSRRIPLAVLATEQPSWSPAWSPLVRCRLDRDQSAEPPRP